MSAMPPVRIVVALIRDGAGRVLLVRKHGATHFMQPGGKPEPDETPLDTLRRELAEELGVRLHDAAFLGAFEDDAVNEPGRRVQAQAYAATVEGVPVAQAEIAELRWIDPHPPHPVSVAPLSAKHLLPLCR